MDRFNLTSLHAELKAVGGVVGVVLSVVKSNNSSEESVIVALLNSIVDKLERLANDVDGEVSSLAAGQRVKGFE